MVGFRRVVEASSDNQLKGTARRVADGTVLLFPLGFAEESGVAHVRVVVPRKLGSP